MRRLVPHPLLSLSLLGIWLLAQNTLDPGHIVLGGLLGLLLPPLTMRFWPEAPRVRRPGKLLVYILVFLWDVLVANLQVALWILGPTSRLRPRWIFIPLDVDHPLVISTLAATISLTPGTVSSHISADRKLLVVHALHCPDDDEAVRQIKERYERPLKEIFG